MKLFFGLIFFVVFIYLIFKILQLLSEKRRLNKIAIKNLKSEQIEYLKTHFRPYKFLTYEEKKRLHFKILYILEYKNFNPIQDFQVTDEMKLMIAAQASLLIVNLDIKIYPSLKNIFIASSSFIEKDNPLNEGTMLPTYNARLGESWKDGPLVLSWNSTKEGASNFKDGHNVVLHEFAHKLDAMDGQMDGTPILHSDKDYKKWEVFMTKDFINLRKDVTHNRKTTIDPYGATNEAEFFAVTVEEFFEQPFKIISEHPHIFEIYLNYFKIDPRKWS